MLAIESIEKPVRAGLGKLKVLLAEDNEVNQLLARSILQYWGIESKTAVTGHEVLDLMDKEDFDVVLMDIQMPEKSGIEAAKDIRNMSDLKKRKIPIIALTANALKGEEKKYIAVGMDDYLTKPFKENELYEVISRVLKNEGSFGRDLNSETIVEESQNKSVIYPDATQKLYDLSLVTELARGNQDFIQSLTKIFVDTIPPTADQLKVACSEGNWDQTSKLAHKLKSTIDTMNISSIKDDIRTIEANGKYQKNLAEVPALVDKVKWVIEQTTAQLKIEFPGL
jgi:CheY-like chemotaxis protein